jgi:hypothetical protein
MSRNPELCRSFVLQAKKALSEHPQIQHTWSIDDDEDHCILDIPETNEDGFPITAKVYPEEITIIAGGAHTTLLLENDPNELAAHALGLIRDLLGPGMRIRERLAGGKPYKWAFELYQDGQWKTEEEIGLCFWNYFGKRSEKTYQNMVLPARENAVEPALRP